MDPSEERLNDDAEFEIGTCDDCGVPILVPVEDINDVNYCEDCSPVKEEFDPTEESVSEFLDQHLWR